jgi:hypothetical protein
VPRVGDDNHDSSSSKTEPILSQQWIAATARERLNRHPAGVESTFVDGASH